MREIKLKDLRGPNGGIMFGKTEVLAGHYEVKILKLHEGAHLDEVVAGEGLKREGGRFFPGINEAVVTFTSHDAAKQLDAFTELTRGCLILGTGDSPFNEHETATRGRVEGHCSASIVAELIGVSGKPGWKSLIPAVRDADLTRVSDTLHLSIIIKAMHEAGVSDEDVYAWTAKAIDAIILRRSDFTYAVDAWKDVGRLEEVRLGDGRKVWLAVVNADEEVFGRYALARAPRGLDAAAVISITGVGNLYFGTNERSRIHPAAVAEAFRLLSVTLLQKKGSKPCTSWLKAGAALPDDVESLHQFKPANAILNKGESVAESSDPADTANTTRIPRGLVVSLVKAGLAYRCPSVRSDRDQNDQRQRHDNTPNHERTSEVGRLSPAVALEITQALDSACTKAPAK